MADSHCLVRNPRSPCLFGKCWSSGDSPKQEYYVVRCVGHDNCYLFQTSATSSLPISRPQALPLFKRETMSDKPGNPHGMIRIFIPPSYLHHHGYPARIFPRSTAQPWPADPAASHRSLGPSILQHLPKSRVLHHAAGTQPNTRYRAENPVVSHVPLPTEAAAALSNHITRMQPI